MGAIRLQKFLAEAGVASRRASERLIVEGRVSVNGATASELGTKVNPDTDTVAVDGKTVRARKKLYVALNKPAGFITTRHDPEDRQTVLDLVPKEWQHLAPVGRLDRESEGLLLLTNDGDFLLKLTHPRYNVRKIYRVVVQGSPSPAHLRQLEKGVESEGETLTAARARLLSQDPGVALLEIELTEGKNREIRRMLATLGCEVLQLRRIQLGPLKLGELPIGRWRVLSPVEVKSLLRPHQ